MPLPSLSTFVDHTFCPVSALTAKTHPVVEPMYMQPPAITGVPVKSPSPPPCEAENAHALVRVGTTVGVSGFSARCDRVWARSWPYDDQSPPALCADAQCAPADRAAAPAEATAPAEVTAPAAGTPTATLAAIGSQRRDPSIRRPRPC